MTPDLDTLRAAVTSARAAHDLARTAGEKTRAWDQSAKALGSEPQVDVPGTAPKAPPGERPTRDDRNVATATIANADKAAGAAERQARQIDKARGDVAIAETYAADTIAAAARAEVLVVACREAPGKVLAGQMAALGDMGPVTLDFTDTGVVVNVDGKTWDAPLRKPSTGELLRADLYFRAALARVGKLTWAHLFIDGRQDLDSALPEVGARVVALRTAPGALRVSTPGERVGT